jgi:hypothetical protein
MERRQYSDDEQNFLENYKMMRKSVSSVASQNLLASPKLWKGGQSEGYLSSRRI